MFVSNYIDSPRPLYSLFLRDTMTSGHKTHLTKKFLSLSLFHTQLRATLKNPQNEDRRALRSAVIVMEELECRLFVIPKLSIRLAEIRSIYFFFFSLPSHCRRGANCREGGGLVEQGYAGVRMKAREYFDTCSAVKIEIKPMEIVRACLYVEAGGIGRNSTIREAGFDDHGRGNQIKRTMCRIFKL